ASSRGDDRAALGLFREARRVFLGANLGDMATRVETQIAQLERAGRGESSPGGGESMGFMKASELGLFVMNSSLRGLTANATVTLLNGSHVSGLLHTRMLTKDLPVMTLEPFDRPALQLNFSEIRSVSVRLDDGTTHDFS